MTSLQSAIFAGASALPFYRDVAGTEGLRHPTPGARGKEADCIRPTHSLGVNAPAGGQ